MYSLDTARRITWQDTVGISGGIPSTYTKYGSTIQASTYGNGASDATAGINAALAAASPGQYVLLSAGTFRLNSQLIFTKGVVLRGAGSSQTPGVWANQTILNSYAAWHAIQMGNWPSTPVDTAVSGSPVKGATTLTVASVATPSLSVGDYLVIDQVNDGVEVINVDDISRDSNTRCLSQITRITEINDLVITIDPPLFHEYAAAQSPQVWELNQGTTMTVGAGIEDLQLVRISPTGTEGYSNVKMVACAGCWVKNVESKVAQFRHVDLDRSYRCEIRHNYFNDGMNHGIGGFAYGVVCGNRATGNLIEDNIFRRLRHSMVAKEGATGNVFGYNYSYATYQADGWLAPDLMLHGSHATMNLFEGNYATKADGDDGHGSSSYNTFHRNYLTRVTTAETVTNNRYPVSMHSLNTYTNWTGNVLGTSGQSWTAFETGATRSTGSTYVYSWGFVTDGDTTRDSTTPRDTALRHGNYDDLNDAPQYSDADHTLPNSLYLAASPPWFGSLPWPSVNYTTGVVTTIPAKYRIDNGVDPSSAPVGVPVLSVR